jgi:pimeloyl-ACP methyl ester carboxylesterase
MILRKSVLLLTAVIAVCGMLFADVPKPGKNTVSVRGQAQNIYYFPASGASRGKVLFAPGDGGWRGFALEIAKQMQAAGYDVYGLDTRLYLQSFADSGGLKTSDIAADYRQIADWIRQGGNGRVLLTGWSEGAGLGLAAAADKQNKSIFEGLVAIGMTEQNILAWRWTDAWAEVTKKVPNEPTFPSSLFVGQVSPLPFFIIASSDDEYTSPEATRSLVAAARDPKKFVMIEARDHKYGGNTETLFRTLRDALLWIVQQHR